VLVLAGLLAVLCTALVGGASAASNCKEKGNEGRGCPLPNGSTYHVRKGHDNEMSFRVRRHTSRLSIRSSCAFHQARSFTTNARPKVGQIYSFEQTKSVTGQLADGRPTVTTYKLKIRVNIKSAKKAVATGTAKAFMPAVPPQGTSPGEDEVRLNCSLHRTLKRVGH
jgi:hypothetical protein